MKNFRYKYLIAGISLTLLCTIGFSMAYFVATIVGEGKEITVTTEDLKIVFTDGTVIEANGVQQGYSTSKTFTVKNESDATYEYNIIIKDLVNTLVTKGGLLYKITSDNDGYNMSDYEDVPKSATATDTELAYSISIPVGVTQTYTIEFVYRETGEDQSEDMGKTFSGSLALTKGTPDPNVKLYDRLLAHNPTRLTRSNFDTVFTDSNVNTLYTVNGSLTEDGSTVYYFAGNAQNNWVQFGQDQDGNALYWRIVRTNEDGGVRLLYVGPDMATTSAYPVLDGVSLSGGSATTGMYNSTANDRMYAGYMYGTTGDLASNRTNETSSPIKTVLDSWYSKTINTKTDGTYTYDSYVSKTAIYCNDRSTDAYSTTADMYYGAYDRLVTYKKPSYKCGNDETGVLYSNADVADKFSVSTTSGGNGDLTYPIALITADELAIAGGAWLTNSPSWFYYNSEGGSATGDAWWWTMSPSRAYSDGAVGVIGVLGSDYPARLGYSGVHSSTPGARPVVSLKSCVMSPSGDGSSTNPYLLKVNDKCAEAEN